ncbi:MAG: prepilin-type N-terminal cleavage/methylation domain-containing protein [Patescibacteria group bacterium]
MNKSNSKGFTLIELLVVIAIIGLLSTLAVVALNSARQKSRDSKRVADVKQMQTALELFFADQNLYPAAASATVLGYNATPANALKILCSTPAAGFVTTATGCASPATTYMGLVPAAPLPVETGCTAGENDYTYTSASPYGTYTLTFCLGGKVGDLVAGTHTANPNGIQ